MTICDSRSVSL